MVKKKKLTNRIVNEDCLKILKQIENNSIDLIFTSPPYGTRRKKCYNSISSDKYVNWFLPIAKEIKRVMTDQGSFFLNIKEHCVDGHRDLYVKKLIIALVENVGFNFVDEFCWTKNAFPGRLVDRLKNGWEPIFHFTKSHPREITFNPVACGTPIKEESIARTYRKQCGAPKNKSGMTGMNTTNIRKLKLSRPSNHIHINNVSNQFTLKSKHPATFPVELPEFFIKIFSNEGDLICDPFAGSGSTAIACLNTNRKYFMIDNNQEYCDLIKERIKLYETNKS